MSKPIPKPSLLHLSRVKKTPQQSLLQCSSTGLTTRNWKTEIQGTKLLPNNQELHVSWQVPGRDIRSLVSQPNRTSIFHQAGHPDFQNNFAKTVTFHQWKSPRFFAIQSVHGKFYQRLKVAMDRFIPLGLRGFAAQRPA